MRPEAKVLVVLEDAMILGMSQHPAFTSQFPFLAALEPYAKSCGSCHKAQRQKAEALSRAKAGLAALAGPHQELLKSLLNCRQVRIAVPLADGTFRVAEY